MLVVLWLAPDGIVGEVQRWLRRRQPAALATPGRARTIGPHTRFTRGHRSHDRVRRRESGDGRVVHGGAGNDHQPDRAERRRQDHGAQYARRLLPRRQPARSISAAQRSPASAAWRIARAGIARTYQTSQLFGSLSVLENLVIASPQRCRHRARSRSACSSFVGYRGDLHARAADLPHVDRRLVEIARALADTTRGAAARRTCGGTFARGQGAARALLRAHRPTPASRCCSSSTTWR